MRVLPACSVASLTLAVWAMACTSQPGRETADRRTNTAGATAAATAGTSGVAYVCPMDRDIRSDKPGKCSRCGMELVAGIPDPNEYELDLTAVPQPAQPDEPIRLTFTVFDPWKHKPVRNFAVVHERLFHTFIVSRDLEYFLHDHPVWKDSAFEYTAKLPRSGQYRILTDFYPQAATPQLLTKTVFVAGPEMPMPSLIRDYATKQASNITVAAAFSPEAPIAGTPTQIRFTVNPADGLERYLGAWGHMLIGSDDLIDMIHTHPLLSDGSPEMQFAVIFPRAHAYRLWVQFQRHGVVNTAHFDVLVDKAPATDPH